VSSADVHFHPSSEKTYETRIAAPGEEVRFSFACPLHNRRCGDLLIAGRTTEKRDGQNKNGGVAQWDWNGNREAPTFTPSVNCKGCWHGWIKNGRCFKVDNKTEE
jgi:uncharacterized protein DUF6527